MDILAIYLMRSPITMIEGLTIMEVFCRFQGKTAYHYDVEESPAQDESPIMVELKSS